MTPIKNRLKSESDWCSGYSSTRGNLTHGGPLLAVSPRTVSVEDPDNFIKATVELRTVGRETQGMGRCQLIQVVVGSKRRTEVPIERVPYVDWVVPATACNAEGKSEKWEKYTEIHCMLLKYIAKSKNFFFSKTREFNIRLDNQSGFHPNRQHKRPIHYRESNKWRAKTILSEKWWLQLNKRHQAYEYMPSKRLENP